MNRFSSSFFQTVAEENPYNLITSPFSAAVTLAMAAYGAEGETDNQFKNILHLPSENNLDISSYQAIIDDLDTVQENELRLLTKIFVPNEFTMKPTYKDVIKTYFRSSAQAVDFTKSQIAANIINTWIQQNTNNLVRNIDTLDDLDDRTKLVLVNGMYFRGQWKDKFKLSFTQDRPFYIGNSRVENVPTMYRQDTFRYGELYDLDAKFIVIPYKGAELSMVIILPNAIDGLAQVEKKLKNVNLANILHQGYETKLRIYLPKFKVESTLDLESVLQRMGLSDAFTERANFSGISNRALQISQILHTAYIEFDEEGTTAAGTAEISRKYLKVTLYNHTMIHNVLTYKSNNLECLLMFKLLY
ncbi:serine protease inhibitor 3/4-like [Xylocopa sonorina]|uniref:serine protease inhibitor 3/4-like n=1 Tax=Xylocopa sonorina TaxID=1818115 RepID=UPI00403A8D03